MDQKSGKPSQKRRAILQGSLAAPVVLTVSSASAQALNSVGRRLVNQANEQPAESIYFTQSKDKWFRRSVPVVKLRYQGKLDKMAREDWYYLDPADHKYVRLSTMERMAFGTFLPDDWKDTKETGTRQLLVWLDPKTGAQNPVMQVKPLSGQIAATCSCLGSFLSTEACPPA